ncbi:MAG: hypothetical protein IJS58_00630 [Bacilli bacterium]|nr:hypothetical protein [Bacilli bacterium]
MNILENEKIILKGINKCKKKDFYLLNMITSLHIFALASIVFLFIYKYVNVYIVYGVALFVYIIFVLFQTKKTYLDYQKFFGFDEIVITEDRVYYNICMNKKGNYLNFDSYIDISEIKDLNIKKGLYPQRLNIIFNTTNETKPELNNVDDNSISYINVHCLDNAKEIYDYLSCKIDKKSL